MTAQIKMNFIAGDCAQTYEKQAFLAIDAPFGGQPVSSNGSREQRADERECYTSVKTTYTQA